MKVTERKLIPSADDAEKWLSPEVFIYNGKKYYISPKAKIMTYEEAIRCGSLKNPT